MVVQQGITLKLNSTAPSVCRLRSHKPELRYQFLIKHRLLYTHSIAQLTFHEDKSRTPKTLSSCIKSKTFRLFIHTFLAIQRLIILPVTDICVRPFSVMERSLL